MQQNNIPFTTTVQLEQVISDAKRSKAAILKFISPNDVGKTGAHQYGYYLPKAIWNAYTPHPPEKGKNYEHFVEIIWHDGRITESCIKWYGKGTRSEYRLTRFGRDFPYLKPDKVGDLLILIPTGPTSFRAYVLNREEDIEGIEAALDIELTATWAYYDAKVQARPETENKCIDRLFNKFCAKLKTFPPTAEFSQGARAAFIECTTDIKKGQLDHQLIRCIDLEYRLFRMAERRICMSEIKQKFSSIEDFLSTAATIMNRRKARAGRALENHVEHILKDVGIPFAIRPDIDGKPDIIIPGKDEYLNKKFPTSKLFMIGVKTTCKDRWRQVLNEAKRVPHKHILTLQQGISEGQLKEMHESNVSLIVPEPIQKQYPKSTKIKILSFKSFINSVKEALL